MAFMFRRTRSHQQPQPTHRAAVYDHRSPQNIRIISKEIPILREGYSLVKVFYAGLNPVDAKVIVGDKFPEGIAPYFTRFFTNYTVGFDFSGQIVQSSSSHFNRGDPVFGFNYQLPPLGFNQGGTLQEYALVPNHEIWVKPESLTYEQAAALPLVGVTALQAFEQHNLKIGQKLLVIGGSGGVGHIATSIAAKKGIDTVAICSTSNVKFVQNLDAKVTVLDYTAECDVMQQLDSYVAKEGKFDLVLDTVTSADSRDKDANYPHRIRFRTPPILKACRGINDSDHKDVDAHNYVVLGGEFVHWWTALMKRLCNVNWFTSGFELFWIKMNHSTEYLKELKILCDEHGLRPKVSTVPFTEEGCREAFKSLHPSKDQRRSTVGKIVVKIYGSVE